jgi:hypothetical protein
MLATLSKGSFSQRLPKGERLLTQSRLPEEPVKIYGMSVRGTNVRFGEPFQWESDRWIHNLELYTVNASKKNVGYMEFDLELYRSSKHPAPDVVLPLIKGKNWVTMDELPPKPVKAVDVPGPFVLEPGMSHISLRPNINLADKVLEIMGAGANTEGAIPYGRIVSSKVIFTDDTMWREGNTYVRDINNPHVWMNLSIRDNPSKMSQYQEMLEKIDRGEKISQTIEIKPSKQERLSFININSTIKKFSEFLNPSIITMLPFWVKSVSAQGSNTCGYYQGAEVTINCTREPCATSAPRYFENECGTHNQTTYQVNRFCSTGEGCDVAPPQVSLTFYNRCDSSIFDRDEDGRLRPPCGTDCCDSDPNVFPSASPKCDGSTNQCGGQDWNCNGTPDPQERGCQNGTGVGCSDAQCLLVGAYCDPFTGYCYTPILIDVLGNGFHLTNAVNGVRFDLDGNGSPNQTSWTTAEGDDAWLFLDRNGNGKVDDGTELFGNFTQQPPSLGKNGFLALAEFDKPINGGNGDRVIDRHDRVFSTLRLWQDKNHNGVSESNELHTLQELGVASVEVEYRDSRRIDRYGNIFRYWSKVQGIPGSSVGPRAYDIFLVTTP